MTCRYYLMFRTTGRIYVNWWNIGPRRLSVTQSSDFLTPSYCTCVCFTKFTVVQNSNPSKSPGFFLRIARVDVLGAGFGILFRFHLDFSTSRTPFWIFLPSNFSTLMLLTRGYSSKYAYSAYLNFLYFH